eukprot:6185626-Pleurochrysis_carterae.AAC.1
MIVCFGVEYAQPPKPEMNKMLVQLGVSVLASRAIKLLDKVLTHSTRTHARSHARTHARYA